EAPAQVVRGKVGLTEIASDDPQVTLRRRHRLGVSRLLEQPEALFEERPGGNMVALVASEHSERDEAPADPVHVTQLAVNREALFVQRTALRIVSLLIGEAPRCLQGLGSGSGASLGRRQREQGGHPLPSLVKVAAAAPEAPERTAEAQAVVGRAVTDKPGERRAQVVVVLLQDIEPFGLPPSSEEVRLSSFG